MSNPSHKMATSVKIAAWYDLEGRMPAYVLVANVDRVIVRYEDQVSVLYRGIFSQSKILPVRCAT